MERPAELIGGPFCGLEDLELAPALFVELPYDGDWIVYKLTGGELEGTGPLTYHFRADLVPEPELEDEPPPLEGA